MSLYLSTCKQQIDFSERIFSGINLYGACFFVNQKILALKGSYSVGILESRFLIFPRPPEKAVRLQALDFGI